jgi:CAAX prenyl protease-like protein
MDSESGTSGRRGLTAWLLPMAAFLGFLVLASLLPGVGKNFWLVSPQYWIYPLQAFICGGLVIWFWREYQFRPPARIILTLAIGLLVFAGWIAPQQFFGFAPRTNGFNPEVFAAQSACWTTVILRFVRLVLVVPFVEEIFWRGFLLRYLIDEKFHRVPVGTFSWLSFAVVTLGFGFSHAPEDRIAALITGALYNGVAYRTKSLASCVLAHAATNLLLGLWIMKTRQWGFW